MKKIIMAVICFWISSAAMAQNKFDNWKELKSFHTVMSETFHPSEEGNLKPIRERADELYKKAEALSKSTIPAEINTPETHKALHKLAVGCNELKTLIDKKGNDADVTKKLSEVHDLFHTIVEKCAPKSGDSHNHEGHNHN
ncbi:MAG: hypothetical protein JNK61_11800 [Bacteroidia bacterium]|nr:hypothetical protein [Bacteroidia bacterium]